MGRRERNVARGDGHSVGSFGQKAARILRFLGASEAAEKLRRGVDGGGRGTGI